MTKARSLTFSVGLLIWSAQIQGHEFWIEPSKHYTTVNSTIELTLKVGETFRGSAQPYLPVDTATFIVIGQTQREMVGLFLKFYLIKLLNFYDLYLGKGKQSPKKLC